MKENSVLEQFLLVTVYSHRCWLLQLINYMLDFMFQAKMLEEMDEEFGIGNLVEQEFTPKQRKVC